MSDEIQQVCIRCNMPTEQRVHRTVDEFQRRFGYRPTAEQVKWLAFALATGDFVQRVKKAKRCAGPNP